MDLYQPSLSWQRCGRDLAARSNDRTAGHRARSRKHRRGGTRCASNGSGRDRVCHCFGRLVVAHRDIDSPLARSVAPKQGHDDRGTVGRALAVPSVSPFSWAARAAPTFLLATAAISLAPTTAFWISASSALDCRGSFPWPSCPPVRLYSMDMTALSAYFATLAARVRDALSIATGQEVK
jgi:hypothetical protein